MQTLLTVAAAALLILFLGGGPAFLHLPALEGARVTVAARLLESYLGEPIVATGGVALGYGTPITVAAHRVTPIGAAAEAASDSSAPLDLAPRAIRGRLSSREGGFEIDEAVVEIGLASVLLQEIGSIRIGRIARDTQGRLDFEDIELVQGDIKDPKLTLNGHLHDVLAMRDPGPSARWHVSAAHGGTSRELVLETDKMQAPGGGTRDLRIETLGLRSRAVGVNNY
jgi:hypothetical protein